MVLDLYARRVVGWAMSRSPDSELTKQALAVAYEARGCPEGVLFHSDQGCHYSSQAFRERLNVKSRMVINLLYKNLRAFLLPLLERLNGRDMAQGTLGDVMVVDLPVVEEGLFEILG